MKFDTDSPSFVDVMDKRPYSIIEEETTEHDEV
jgi:hypothetical protein